MDVVHLDRWVAWRCSLLTLLLAWPLIVFGSPAYMYDSPAYYKGGRVAVSFALNKIALRFDETTFRPDAAVGRDRNPPSERSLSDIKGARSIPYSITAYLLRAPGETMTVLVLAQAFVTALTITIMALALGVKGPWRFAILAATLALATPAACFADLAIADIFAGLTICVFALLTTHFDRLSVGSRLTLIAIGAFAVAGHASHPPLAAGICVVGMGSAIFAYPTKALRLGDFAWLLAPLALGVTTTVVTGLIGFGEVSLAPKRYPLALARSLEDGPARWYLQQNCATRRYVMCQVYGDDIPGNVTEFLWGDRGVITRATPAQMDQIRAEEAEIVLLAAEAYPSAAAARTLSNIGEELIHFGLNSTRFDQRFALDAAGTPYLEPLGSNHTRVLDAVEILSIASVLVSLAWTCWRFRASRPEERALLLLVAVGIVGNAVICAVFSGVADRYQARVIWVLPMACMAIALASRNTTDRQPRAQSPLPPSAADPNLGH